MTCDLTLIAPLTKGDKEWCRLLHGQYEKFGLNVRREFVVPVKKNGIMFEGYQYNCPADAREFLVAHYGYLGKDSCYDKETGLYVKRPEKKE